MKNQDIYQTNPASRKLVNEGVASVNDEKTNQALAVLRYELETFVCDGQYERGLHHILDTYLKNIEQAQQPAVWVSGFYGSGKSHLVKMMRALWEDVTFSDGATARGIAHLPQNISDQLRELSTQGRRHGGLFAASGTLGAGASGSVRLALLGIIFKSAGLPESYPVASFVMWLKKEGIYEAVREEVERGGNDWDEELDNFHVAEGLYLALCKIKPNVFSTAKSAVEILPQLYPNVTDVTSDEMIKAIRQALTADGKFPLTLIVLDEVQQYIGEDSNRSIAVQEMVESVTKNIGGKLLFVGTGQTAVTGTANLARLQGRFTIRVELSDADVDNVIRKVILAKKPEFKAPIEQIMQVNIGEISRHLSGTTIGHRQTDIPYFSQDYPILPVRRRFWENTLRVLDQTGTDSQLRNQLSMVHKVTQTNLDDPLGHVIPADYLYFDSADKLLQSRILPRKVYDQTQIWNNGSDDERLTARACGLIFLINKLAGSNQEIDIRADIDTLADLLVEDISAGSSALRGKLPKLLESCPLVMKVGSDYRIQTEESQAWTDEYGAQTAALASQAHRIDAERDDRLKKKFGEIAGRLPLNHGNSNISRDTFPIFDGQLPADADKKICIWVRDGWSSDEISVLADARQAGTSSPTVYVFIPKRSADDLRRALIDLKASAATLDKRGVPNTPEGTEARAAMETIRQTAEGKIRELINEIFSGAKVFQGGGSEIIGSSLNEMLLDAARYSLQRLYPQFQTADHIGWAKAYEKAQKGDPDALKAVGSEAEAAQNPVCKAILGFIANGKTGTEIRANFESAPYGWSRDAVDGGLQVLLVAGLVQAKDEQGKGIDPRSLERKALGKTTFKVESTTVNSVQRIQIRKLLQKVGINAKSNEELSHVPAFLQSMLNLAARAGGVAPKPAAPETSALEDIRLSAGNEQLIALYNSRDDLAAAYDQWTALAARIEERYPSWEVLKRLQNYATAVPDAEIIAAQIKIIEDQRQLLEEPDLIAPLTAKLTQLLRDELNAIKSSFDANWEAGSEKLSADENFRQLEIEQKHALRLQQQLVEGAKPVIEVENTQAVLKSLTANGISALRDRVAAMPSRFDKVILEAAKLLEPEVEAVALPSRMLKTDADIEAWLTEAKEMLQTRIKRGPVIV